MCDVYGVTWNVTGGLYPGSRCYYLRFLYGYADMTELLRQLLKKGSVCTWTLAYDAAFEELKRRLTSRQFWPIFLRRIKRLLRVTLLEWLLQRNCAMVWNDR